jgi:hypothetical protein
LATERLLLTLWVGSLCAIGYLAVPMAFATLPDVTVAGNYAGKLFAAVNYLGLAVGSVLVITKLIAQGKEATKSWRFQVVTLMLMLTLAFIVYLQPEIAMVKAQMQDNVDLMERFSLLHTISENLYLFISLLGLALVLSTDKVESSNGQK